MIFNKVFLFTNIPPHYRRSLWLELLKNNKQETHFFYGENLALGINPIDFSAVEFLTYKNQLHQLKNIWINGKILIWQKGVISKCLKSKFDFGVFLGDMYCFSTWIGAIICQFRGIRVIFWGHGIYGNESKLKLFFRKTFYRLADQHLLYERRAKSIMHSHGFKPNNLYVVFNSLDYDTHKALRYKFENLNKSEVFPFFSNSLLPVIVFVGRLTAVKKLNLLLDAVKMINSESVRVNLLFIGEGPVKESLEFDGKVGLVNRWLHFLGACYNEETIGKFLSTSDLCISPGNVGLTAIHSLSLGTPVVTHNNFSNQMPEAEAIIDGYNGFFFKENDLEDLKEKILIWFNSRSNRNLLKDRCYEIIDKYYNPYYQINVFHKLFNSLKPEL